MWRSVSLLICTLLCMISLSEADCKMTFFPNEINSPAGVRQMLSSKLGEIRQQTIGDPYDIRSKSKFNFAVQLLSGVNPRLCRFIVTKNKRMDFYQDPNNIERYPLSPEYGLPSARCMISDQIPGVPVESFAKFGRGGVIGSPNDLAVVRPLCGNMFYFDKGTKIMFDGEVDYGTKRVLECQSSDPKDSNQYTMIPLFQIDCLEAPKPPAYIPTE